MRIWLFLTALAVPLCGLIGWALWLRFCRHVFDRAGSAALDRVPQVAAAYRRSSFAWRTRRDRQK